MKKIILRCALPVLFAVFVLAAVPGAPAQAAKTVSVDATNKAKKAPELSTKKTYTVTQKNNYYYVKFTAPKAGTYRITISDIKTTKASKPAVSRAFIQVRI